MSIYTARTHKPDFCQFKNRQSYWPLKSNSLSPVAVHAEHSVKDCFRNTRKMREICTCMKTRKPFSKTEKAFFCDRTIEYRVCNAHAKISLN